MRLGRRGWTRNAGLSLLALAVTSPTRAQSTLCTPITAVPHVVREPGVYCLDRDLVMDDGQGSGTVAIYIDADHVVLDFNGYSLRRLPVNMGWTTSTGVFAHQRSHITIRNGTIRNFSVGIYLQEISSSGPYDQGHVVEGMNVDGSSYIGMWVNGAGSVVRRNRVLGTGGTEWVQGADNNAGIRVGGVRAQVTDNEVTETRGGANGPGHAIHVDGVGAVVEGNRVGNAARTGVPAFGITLLGADHLVVGNRLAVLDNGVYFGSGASGKYRDNLTVAVTTPYQGGTDVGNNQ
jgi:hypothetical protein